MKILEWEITAWNKTLSENKKITVKSKNEIVKLLIKMSQYNWIEEKSF